MSNKNNNTYSVKSKNYTDTDNLYSLKWLNSIGQEEAPGGLPAEIKFYPSGNVKELYWYRAGELHRENDLPAHVAFKDNPNSEITWAFWSIDGKPHREGELPSTIKIDEDDGRVSLLRFCRHGEECDVGGLPSYIWINPDGSTEDEGGYPIDVDLSRFEDNLPRPPPIVSPPFFQPG